ncbi:hypothetical protein B566_EDAN006953 [Ephemera danica]|nr:hypothetical protein B566_EDAN006953 [Ephemera danica]
MAERPEDLNLPLSVVTRLVKDALPIGISMSKEARVALARSASVFVLYLTSSANLLAHKEKRSTIRGQDVIKALDDTDFTHFEEPLTKALEHFKKGQQDKKDASEKRKQQKKSEQSKDQPQEEPVKEKSFQQGTEEEPVDIADDSDE